MHLSAMNLLQESCLEMPHCKLPRRKPMIQTRRNPNKRDLLLNIMPVNTDPGLSPSTSRLMSPVSHRSSLSSASELEQPLSGRSARQGGKINQLIKVNDAIAVELADLEFGKERWLEKLKLLEARICSNLVNIDKWAAENKSKMVSHEAVRDGGYVTDLKVGQSPLYGAPSTWQLSLTDLVSIFKGSKLEHGDTSPLQHIKDDTPHFPSREEYVSDSGGHEGASASSNKQDSPRNNGFYSHGEITPLMEPSSSTFKGSACSHGDSPVSPNDPTGENAFLTSSSSRVEKLGFLHGEITVPLEKASTPLQQAQSADDPSDFSKGALQRSVMLGQGEQSHTASSQARLDAVSMEEVEVLKQHAHTLEKEKLDLESTLKDCRQALHDAKSDIASFRSQKEQLQTMLTDLKTSSESARLALLKERDDQANKALCSVKSLEEAQQSAIVLERKKLVLQSEINYCRELLDKTQQEVKAVKKGKAALEAEYAGCKQELEEAQQGAMVLEKERDAFAAASSECKRDLEKNRKHCLMLEMEKDKLQRDLAQSKQTLEEVLQKSYITERERRDLQGAHQTLISDLEKSEQHAVMLENENAVLENVLVEFKHTLDQVQQHIMVVEREKDDLQSELIESKQACKEAWQHAVSLEAEKGALEIGSCEYKEVLEEEQQHVLTLQSALEGTLQRADALDHQVQRLRFETKRLCENNESLKALKNEQEAKCRDLETTRDSLEAEIKSFKSLKEAAEADMVKMNALYASVTEERKKERDALQQEQAPLKKEIDNLRALLESANWKSTKLEADQKEMQERLNDGERNLQKARQELDAMIVERENAVAALKIEMENDVDDLREKLKGRDVRLQSMTGELEAMKADMVSKLADLESERSAKLAILAELATKDDKLKELEKSLTMIRAEQTALRGAMKDEMVKKTELMQKIHDEEGRTKELEVALELAKLERNTLLIELENERLAKEAALEQSDAIESHSQELEKDLRKLQAEVDMMREEDEEQADTIRALHEEQARSRELEEAMESRNAEQEEAEVAWEEERDANMQELEQERRQGMKLEEQLRVLRAEEEKIGAVMQEERAAMERLKKQLGAQEARCEELENALNCARIEKDSMQRVLEEEAISKRAVMQELKEQRDRCSELEVLKEEGTVNADRGQEVKELLAKSKKLEQLLSTIQSKGADHEAQSAVTREVKELQARIQDVESRLADAGYVRDEERKGKDEDELLTLLEESPMFEPGAATNSEPHADQQRESSMDVARQTEEELRKLKESTETFHHALFDAHHTAISDVASLLVELKSLKRLLNDKTAVVANDRKEEEKRKGKLSLPTAALSTSALAALGLLAFLKFPKHNIT